MEEIRYRQIIGGCNLSLFRFPQKLINMIWSNLKVNIMSKIWGLAPRLLPTKLVQVNEIPWANIKLIAVIVKIMLIDTRLFELIVPQTITIVSKAHQSTMLSRHAGSAYLKYSGIFWMQLPSKKCQDSSGTSPSL